MGIIGLLVGRIVASQGATMVSFEVPIVSLGVPMVDLGVTSEGGKPLGLQNGLLQPTKRTKLVLNLAVLIWDRAHLPNLSGNVRALLAGAVKLLQNQITNLKLGTCLMVQALLKMMVLLPGQQCPLAHLQFVVLNLPPGLRLNSLWKLEKP